MNIQVLASFRCKQDWAQLRELMQEFNIRAERNRSCNIASHLGIDSYFLERKSVF